MNAVDKGRAFTLVLRIIPFVAADALVKDKDDNVATIAVTGYPASAVVVPPELKPTDINFYDIITQKNRFRPPEETEGGFIPREPPYFNSHFHSSDLNLEIGIGVTVAPEVIPIPNHHRKNDEELSNSCLYGHKKYSHGQIFPSRVHCIICMCYYGEIMCSNKKCPPLKIGCQRVNNPRDKCCSKIICVDDLESPTVVLDRRDSNLSSQHEPTVSSDPFRNVIKTEPAPDLPSLIGDMMIPYLVEHGVTTTRNNDEVKPLTEVDRKLVSQYKTNNYSADTVSLTSPKIVPNVAGNEGDSIFSLELFFNEQTSDDVRFNKTTMKGLHINENLIKSTMNSTSISLSSTISTATTTMMDTRPAMTTTNNPSTPENNLMSTKIIEEDSTITPSRGLLKLAGCNIYGRMYRVDRIIMELSNPCLECRCTEIGVQCKNLDC